MNEQQAIALVQKTFKSAFDKQGYIHFLKNLLNEFDDEGARSNQGARIPDKFQNYVEKLERVGKYLVDDHEIMLFIVYLKNDTSIERARTMQRNFVASYLQKDMKDAALVAFVSKDPADWRFSFIKMEYRYDEEKNKIKEEFTPAKRWSFLVGANEASHTAQRKLVPLMADDEHNPTLADLEEAFNIEKVTKEFFEKYRGLFIRTKEELDEAVSANPKTRSDFESKGIDTVNLAKKLLGQIIFLYYLQKKGWFGVERDSAWSSGSRNFLRELFDGKHGDYKNFFNDILEPLFYDALRRDRSEDDHYYPKFNCKIPFLNGGLFDPMNNYDWVKTDILLANELFHNQTKTKEGDEGDGILDIFDRYNFTVKEDEPFEKEVAIDPELLGKAYEKFNAIRPDNYAEFLLALKSGKKGDESKFNKQYGVYYTPREIVHYMCQQSLINYLSAENSEKGIENSYPTKDDFATLILKGEQIKEHDERVATEGRETATYSFQMPESIRNHAALIDEKLANIKVCDPAVGSGAFPVGMMSEIVRAREALDIYTIRPDRFPKESDGQASLSAHRSRLESDSVKPVRSVYAFKRGCIENSLYGVDIDSGAVEIAKLRLWLSLVVDEDDIQNIKPLPNLDYKIVCGNSLIGVEKNLFNVGLFAELESLKPLYFNATNVSQKQGYKTKIDSLIDQITDGRAQFDFEIYFSEVFHDNNGFDVIVGNPPYILLQNISLDKQTLSKLQKYSVAQYKVDTYHLFVEKAVNSLKGDGVLSYIIPNTFLKNKHTNKLREFIVKETWVKTLVRFYVPVFEDPAVDNVIILCQKNKESNKSSERMISIHDIMTQDFLADIERFHVYRQSNIHSPDYYFELESGGNEGKVVEKINERSIELGSIGSAYFGIQTFDRQTYVTKTRKTNHHYPVIDGANVLRFALLPSTEYLDYKPENVKSGGNSSVYNQERIVVRQIGKFPEGCVCPSGIYTLNTIYNIYLTSAKYDLKYVLGIINSKLIKFYWKCKFFDDKETFPKIKKQALENIPIKGIDKELQKPIIKLVDRILAAKAKNPQADTSQIEKEIDELVYQLYELTEDEVKLVEGRA